MSKSKEQPHLTVKQGVVTVGIIVAVGLAMMSHFSHEREIDPRKMTRAQQIRYLSDTYGRPIEEVRRAYHLVDGR